MTEWPDGSAEPWYPILPDEPSSAGEADLQERYCECGTRWAVKDGVRWCKNGRCDPEPVASRPCSSDTPPNDEKPIQEATQLPVVEEG